MVCQTSILTRVVSSCQRCLRPGSKCVFCCVILPGGWGGVGWGKNVQKTCVHTSCYIPSLSLGLGHTRHATVTVYIYVSRELLLRLHMTWMLRYTWRGWSKAGVTFKDQSYCNACTRGANVHSVLTVQERGRQQQSHLAFLAIRYPINFVNIVKNIFDPSIAQLPKKAGPQCLDADWTSLKTGQPNQIKRKQKSNETSKINPRLVNRCYQCCWRRSLDNLPPGKFLKELSKILKTSQRWWMNKIVPAENIFQQDKKYPELHWLKHGEEQKLPGHQWRSSLVTPGLTKKNMWKNHGEPIGKWLRSVHGLNPHLC